MNVIILCCVLVFPKQPLEAVVFLPCEISGHRLFDT